MPLLAVIQTKQVSASIRLSDTTATQVDQYAAFIRASAHRAERVVGLFRDWRSVLRVPKPDFEKFERIPDILGC